MSASPPQSAPGARARVPVLPAGRQRRPSGAPPPLPRHVERSGYIWLAAAIVATGAAIAVFAGGLSRWAVDVTVIDDAMTRRVAGAPVPGFTAVASVLAEAGAALATVIAGFVLLLALIVLRRFRRLLVRLHPATQQAAVDQGLAAQVPVIVGYISRAALRDELAQRSGGRLRLN